MIEIKRILCPIDFSEYSGHALDYAVAMAGWYGATVTALHVYAEWPAVGMIPSFGPDALPPVRLQAVDRDAAAYEAHVETPHFQEWGFGHAIPRLGGSHAQRDLLWQVMADAAQRAGRDAELSTLLREVATARAPHPVPRFYRRLATRRVTRSAGRCGT